MERAFICRVREPSERTLVGGIVKSPAPPPRGFFFLFCWFFLVSLWSPSPSVSLEDRLVAVGECFDLESFAGHFVDELIFVVCTVRFRELNQPGAPTGSVGGEVGVVVGGRPSPPPLFPP